MSTLPTNRTTSNTPAEHLADHNELHRLHNDLDGHLADATPHKTVATNTQTASYVLVLADAGKVVEMNVATANTLTVPPNSSVAFAVGTLIELHQYGAGQTTITPGAGVTIRSPAGLKISAQYGAASLRKRATDEWVAEGRLSA